MNKSINLYKDIILLSDHELVYKIDPHFYQNQIIVCREHIMMRESISTTRGHSIYETTFYIYYLHYYI